MLVRCGVVLPTAVSDECCLCLQIHMSAACSTNFEAKGLWQAAMQARACRKRSAVRSLTVSSQHTHSMLHNIQAGMVHTTPCGVFTALLHKYQHQHSHRLQDKNLDGGTGGSTTVQHKVNARAHEPHNLQSTGQNGITQKCERGAARRAGEGGGVVPICVEYAVTSVHRAVCGGKLVM